MKPIYSLSCALILASCSAIVVPDATKQPPPKPPTDTKAPIQNFTGKIEFIDPTCPQKPQQFCKLKNIHTFTEPDGALAWETDAWNSANAKGIQSGTTNGADIPKAAQIFVGKPFDPGIIQAAIIHDHYTFAENRVRNWAATHRMYLEILLDQGVNPIVAYTQYFAIYTFGDHWIELVAGEKCKFVICNKSVKQDQGQFHEESRLHTDEAANAIIEVYQRLSTQNKLQKFINPLTPERIQRIALEYDPENVFLKSKGSPIRMSEQNAKWLAENTQFIAESDPNR